MNRNSIRGALGLLTSVLCLGFASSAGAQAYDYTKPYDPHGRERAESPQTHAVEIRFGPYMPRVDEEFGGTATPFEDVFGDNERYQVGLEVDWQLLRIPYFGTLGPGVGFGYTRMSGRGFAEDGVTRSEQKSTLTIAPIYGVGVLRYDWLVRELSIPLALYGKAGLGAASWSVSDGQDTAIDDTGSKGRDLAYGTQFALGGMLLLDFFDDSAAVQIDADVGVNNSYWFLEWLVSDLDNGGNGMQIGVNTWVTGITLEM